MFKVPEKYRIEAGPLGSDKSFGNNGSFMIPQKKNKPDLGIIASDELWEHVSVSTQSRCPTWQEMCKIKDMFWGDEDCVIQFHPPKSEYVNNHVFCLHLWRPIGIEIPLPPSIFVGIKK